MDQFYLEEYDDVDDYLSSLGLLLTPGVATPDGPSTPPGGSAFAAYKPRAAVPVDFLGRQYSSSSANVHRRMLQYLTFMDVGSSGAGVAAPASASACVAEQAPQSSRFQHITRERLTRESLSQGFASLHSLLPPGMTKGGKNSILEAAAAYIRELEGTKEELQRAAAKGGGMVVRVRLGSGSRVAIDSFEVVLQSLKAMELRVTAIHSCFCDEGMSMIVTVESKISSYDVKKVVTNALEELENKYSSSIQIEALDGALVAKSEIVY